MSSDFTNFDPYAGYAADNKPAERIKTHCYPLPCKCGHVGAECFNDSYCEPDKPDPTSAEFIKQEYARYREIMRAKMDRLGQIINDLQADYAADCVLWHAIHEQITDEAFTDDVETQDRIEALETTIKVLSGMIE